MRRSLVQFTPFVLLDCVSPVDVQQLVGIHRDHDFSNECVDAPFFKSAQKPKKWKMELWLYRDAISFLWVSYFQENPNIPGTISEVTFHGSEFTFRDNAWGWLPLDAAGRKEK